MGFVRRVMHTGALAGTAWLAWAGLGDHSAWGQDLVWGRRTCPPVQCPPITAPSEPLLSAERAGAFGGGPVALAMPPMLGDFLAPSCAVRIVQVPGQFITIPGTPGIPGTAPIPPVIGPTATGAIGVLIPGTPGTAAIPGTPAIQVPVTASFVVPSASHEFKISDNESPRPQDRFFSSFNFFNNVEGAANKSLGGDAGTINVYRQIIGFEKTFLDGNASVGIRLPFNLLDASNSGTAGLGGTFGDIGDLTLILKALLWEDREMGFLISAGVAVTVPTGLLRRHQQCDRRFQRHRH